MERDAFFARWSELHSGARVEGIIHWWLAISYRIASLLKILRVSPNSLTSIGVLLATGLFLLLENSKPMTLAVHLLALFLLVLSLIADGVDGSLAIITMKSSRFGALWDSLADRISEFLWALAFIALGADYRIIISAWLLASVQEYIRARSAGLGMGEIGVVTICERPVRASLLAIAIVAQALLLLPIDFLESREITMPNEPPSNAFAGIWLLMQLVSIVMLWQKTSLWMKSER